MRISEQLREVALQLPGIFIHGDMSPYICDNLVFPYSYSSLEFLRDLGMGSGTHEFSEFGSEQMNVRKAWLMFAADLADEWGVE